MYPQEHFAYHKRPFWPLLCLKRIGLPCFTFFITIVTCSLQIILLSNYSATYNFSTCRHYHAENHLSFPSAPSWVRHSYLSQMLKLTPYTCGSSGAPHTNNFPGEFYYYFCNLIMGLGIPITSPSHALTSE